MTFGLNILIVIVTVIFSLLAFNNSELFDRFKFNAYLISKKKELWRFFSYALVHASFLHLFVNMYVLYSFGGIVENSLRGLYGLKGVFYYAILYVGGIFFSTVFDFMRNQDDIGYNAIGASGAVSAVVFSSILFYPGGGIYIFPLPFAVPAWLFGLLYLVYSAYMGRRGQDNVGHFAHLWGAVFGVIFTLILVPGIMQHFISEVF